jgi:hypothetical protein
MRFSSRLAAACGSLALMGCDIDVTDLNNPGLESIASSPTRSSVVTATTGLLVGARNGWTGTAGYISVMGIFGRESYILTTDDPRFVTELLIGPLDGGSFGGGQYLGRYANIRNANIVLDAVPKVAALSDEEKAGITGFTKTIQAYDLLLVIGTRDAFGAPIDVNIPPTGEPAPIATRDETYARIIQLLDEANTELGNAGGSFAFPLSDGFDGFDTPATFRQFNRGLRARVALYLGDHATALTALAASFLDTAAPMSLGVYHSFGNASGDATNGSYDPTGRALRGHPSFHADAQLRPGGGMDLRAAAKQSTTTPNSEVQGISSPKLVTVFSSPTSPAAIMRNEELILMRAEAYIGLNQLANAVSDLNVVRTVSGGLAPYAGAQTQAALIDELLYNRRYSLYFEGHRWIDMRRFDRLATLPRDLPSHRVFTAMPFPRDECLARSNPPQVPCTLLPGQP